MIDTWGQSYQLMSALTRAAVRRLRACEGLKFLQGIWPYPPGGGPAAGRQCTCVRQFEHHPKLFSGTSSSRLLRSRCEALGHRRLLEFVSGALEDVGVHMVREPHLQQQIFYRHVACMDQE